MRPNDSDYWLDNEAETYMEELGLHVGQTVLDFGCNQGYYSIPAARAVGPNGSVYALDKDADVLKTVRRTVADAGLKQITIVNTYGNTKTPLADETVDVAFLHDVLHLIGWEEKAGKTFRRSTHQDRQRLLREIYRVMKQGATLSVFCPHLNTHTDVSSEYEVIDEITDTGFYLEQERYRQLLHDGRLEEGHLCHFRKTTRNGEEENPLLFQYTSPHFQELLKQDKHHYAEVTIVTTFAKPGMTAFELGGNRGVTAIALANTVGAAGRVYAFEPVPEYYEALLQNLKRNNIHNVRVHQLAVTDKETTVTYYKHGEGSGIVQADEVDTLVVGTTSVDHLMTTEAIDRVDFINMDCEGAELLALQGAKNTLQKYTPELFCEIHHDYLSDLNQSALDIAAWLEHQGYSVLPVHVEKLEEDVDLKGCTHIYAVKNRPLPDIKALWQNMTNRT